MKLISAVFPVVPGDPEQNVNAMISVMEENPADLYLFPALAVTGVTCGMQFAYKSFIEASDRALDRLCDYTAEKGVTLVTSADQIGNLYIKKGELGRKNEFELDGRTVVISADGSGEGDLILLPTAMAGYPCLSADVTELCQKISAAKNCLVAVANPGFGEAVSDGVYQGFCGVYRNGRTVDFALQSNPDVILSVYDEANPSEGWESTRRPHADLRIPYYGKNDPKKYLGELFRLQVQALYTRIKSSNMQYVAINVSGGLDSTLALMVAYEAMKLAKLPADHLITLTLPCFGTGKRTYTNAHVLMKEVGATVYEIDIKDAVTQHLISIGHDGKTADVTYENAQARMRTQILFDMANRYNALVVGTGDLSELALGFCTFAGDTLSHYNVNASIPKTLIKDLVNLLSKRYGGALGESLADVAATDISPELKEAQKTEDILGPYLLHDFIIYYYSKHRLERDELFQYMMATFDEYDEETIVKTLDTFFRRFSIARFKRNSAGEGAQILGFQLPYVPTDAVMR
ncbi:MAG: NAD(+) synthase [Clostridia bacterium]|nr:NAD(+) synthase [Clostridia bacterium]